MKEIFTKRTFNQKVFSVSPGKKLFRIHNSHIHYKDKNGNFLDSDLSIKAQPDGSWIMNKHNYHFSSPEFADGIFDFYNAFNEANHHIKLKPLAKHVKGTLDIKENAITYKDAFGYGIDYKVLTQRSGVRKIVIIKEKTDKDMSFLFEIILDEKTRNLKESLKDNKEIHVKNTETDMTGKPFHFGNNNKYSFVKQAIVWDSNPKKPKVEKVKLTLFKKDGKLYLKKLISKEFFKNAVFPVMTDHPTNYYSTNADGYILKMGNSWGSTRDAVSGSSAYPNVSQDGYAFSAEYCDNHDFWMYRSFFLFDTSAIPDAYNIDSVDLKIRGFQYDNSSVSAQKGTQADTLTTADYNAFSGDEYGHVDWNASQYNTISFNQQGMDDINKTGNTKICCREFAHDYSNSLPAKYEYVDNGCYFSEWAGVDHDPYLDIEASSGVVTFPVSRLKKNLISGFHSFLNAYLAAKNEGMTPLKLPDGTTF